MHRITFNLSFLLIVFSTFFSGCEKNEEPIRSPEDILGIWAGTDSNYFQFNDDHTVRMLEVSQVDSDLIGTWYDNVYFYEPGYNILLYLDFPNDLEVYQILYLDSNEMQWCWVKSLRDTYSKDDEIGTIIGDIIKEAQEGFPLNPELYQTFHKISEDQFLDIVDKLTFIESDDL